MGFRHAAVLFTTICVAGIAFAQATLHDPHPQIGNQAEAAAANAAMAAQFGPGGRLSPAEQARRRGHKAQLSACNAQVRARHAPGQRTGARAQCRATFAGQRATWARSR